uniref:Immunoglobulin V-set domain-containing protein n=1 Tax=Anas platyrhynchos TaxID=8839 RepID=A0A8B9TKC7_ANAPL
KWQQAAQEHTSTHTGPDREFHKLELDSLSVQCPYRDQGYRSERKAWCRAVGQTGRCELVVSTDTTYTRGISKGKEGRASIQDDTQNRTVTITMEKLQAQDSAVYWCAFYTPNATINFTPIMEVRLSVAKREYLLADFVLASWELPSLLPHCYVAMNPHGQWHYLHSLPFLISMLCEERIFSSSCSVEGDKLEYVLGRGGHFSKCI